MKNILLVSLCLLLLNHAFTQAPCITGRVQTSTVSKPAEVQALPSANCNQIKISWRGSKDQTYIVNAVYTDNITGITTGTTSTLADWSIILHMKPGSSLSWTIQAQADVDGRTFNSYPVRGEYAGCDANSIVVKNNINAASNAAGNKTLSVPVKTALIVYPNPVTGELTIKWTDLYQGKAQLSITDASGKTVRSASVNKQVPEYLDRMPVNTLSPGIYFLQIKMQMGRSLTARFMKN